MKLFAYLCFFIGFSTVAHAKIMPVCDINFKNLKLCGDVEFTGDISRKSDSKFSITIKNPKTQANVKLDKNLNAKLWMVMKGGHEHGSEEVKVSSDGKGKYSIENVWFLMTGEWKVFVDISHKGKTEKAFFNVCVGRNAKSSHLGKCSK